MIYGAIFLKHGRLSEQKQRNGINVFARKNNLKMDSFLSHTDKSFEAVRCRIEHGIPAGRHKGIKNKTHVYDGHESEIVSMYANGETMYSISKKLNLSNPSVKRCLVELNIIKE